MGNHSERSIPAVMKDFNKIFKQLGYRWDYSRIFDDFITMTLAYFSRGDELRKQRDDAMKNYNDSEKQLFSQLFYELMNIYNIEITAGGENAWYDPLGEYYEFLASSSKQSWFGQFFTPDSVVNFMTKIQYSDDIIGKGLRVNDPASGSGRFLIAFHAHYPGNYTFAEDIDPICAKMTAINMMVHGCEGEVVCHNSLIPDDWRFGFWINPDIRTIGLPSIEPIQKEQSVILRMWENQKNNTKNYSTESANIIPQIIPMTAEEEYTINKKINL